MCNIAGYSGEERAAPVLFEMMRRQEGFGGGYHSGIATIDGGKLYYAKIAGDFEAMARSTRALSLPGSTGIAHSRSNSGGGAEWGHPFISCDGKIAYLANGHEGYFKGKFDKDAIAKSLSGDNHNFSTVCGNPGSSAAEIGPGRHVHLSEVKCHFIESCFTAGSPPEDVLGALYRSMPAEIAGLFVHSDYSNIFALRFNQPLMAGATKNAAFLATTAIAFPGGEDMNIFPVPVNSSAVISQNRVEIRSMTDFPGSVAGLIPWGPISRVVTELIESGARPGLQDLKDATAPLWPPSSAPQKDFAVYETLRQLLAEGRIKLSVCPEPGISEGLQAPRIRIVPSPS